MNINELNAIFLTKRESPVIMGILNLDNESFYKESIVRNISHCLEIVEFMQIDGMDVLDLGAFSSKPGMTIPDYEKERKRLMPFFMAIVKSFPELVISIDTMRSEIAREAMDHGAELINDISAGEFDPFLPKLVASYKKIYIAMHMKGLPQNMMNPLNTDYDNIIQDLIKYFNEKLRFYRHIGLEKVILDPGFGFSKNLKNNFKILKDLNILEILNKPILVGISRKSMIWKTLNSSIENSLIGTLIAEFYAVIQGCQIIRVHDIKETVDMLKIFQKIRY